MPIEFEVTDLNSVEEEIRSAYVEKEGKFILDVDRYHEMKAEPLLKKNKQLLDEKKKLAEEKQRLEKVKGSAETDIERVSAEKDHKIAELEGRLRESSIWMPVRDLALKHGVLPERLEDFIVLLRAGKRFDLDADGNLIYRDKHGDETATKPERAFEYWLKDEKPWYFAASQNGGSGSKPGAKGGGSKVMPRDAFNSLSDADKEARISQGYMIVDK